MNGKQAYPTPSISVIMPVFNAAKTLPGALASLETQTMKDFEIIFVDDCSTDGTGGILEEFSKRSALPCTIIRQAANSGVAAARNRGLDATRGEYIAWLDADDRMTPDTLKKALDTAKPLGADIVGFDWKLSFGKSSRYMRQADWDTPAEAIDALCGGTARWNLWLFVIRREFIEANGLRFIPGANMGEDMAFIISAFSVASSAKQIHEALYQYNAVNDGSISKTLSETRRAEIETNLRRVENLIPNPAGLKLYLKLPLLVSGQKEDFELWQSWLSEANAEAASDRMLPFHTRLLQWMAWKKLWAGVRIYYIFVHKFVYGVIFR